MAERINTGEAKDRVSRDFFPAIRRCRKADCKYRGGTDRVRSKRNGRSDGRVTPVRIESTADSIVRPFLLSSFPLSSRHSFRAISLPTMNLSTDEHTFRSRPSLPPPPPRHPAIILRLIGPRENCGGGWLTTSGREIVSLSPLTTR